QGRRAGAVGAVGQLPEERQHRLYRRPRAEDRGGDVADPEFRPQVAERDQGSAGEYGPPSRHGDPELAAGEHRRAGQAGRRAVLSARHYFVMVGLEPAIHEMNPWMAGTRPGMTVGSKGEEGVNAPSNEPSRLQPHLRASQGDVREPRRRPVEARADP